MEEVKHYQVNQRYRIVFERAANVKTDGFKVEVNGDDLFQTLNEAQELYKEASKSLGPIAPVIKKEG